MIPKLNGFKLIEEENTEHTDPNQEEFDWSKINETESDPEDEDSSD